MNKFVFATMMIFAATQVVADPAVEEKYTKTCAICHAAGVAGAPKTGVSAEWEARLAKGSDAMLASVKNGMNAMPPKGMCMDCTDAEFNALIDYMAKAK
jgi:cytochrome c5